MLDTIRHALALLLWVSLPPGILFWFIVHPFIGFWRRVGPLGTYLMNLVPAVAIAWVIYLQREWLLGVDLGFNPWLTAVGAVIYLAAVVIEILCRRHLKLSILVGLPELRAETKPGILLREGIYARVRHPRYVGVFLGTGAFALFINHLSVYLLALVVLPGLRLLVFFEERELVARFGADYEGYRDEVPRFVPRLRAAEGGL